MRLSGQSSAASSGQRERAVGWKPVCRPPREVRPDSTLREAEYRSAAAWRTYSDLRRWRKSGQTAKPYSWTDAQTDTPQRRQALFGRDAVTTTCSSAQKEELGDTIFDVKDGKMTMGLSEGRGPQAVG